MLGYILIADSSINRRGAVGDGQKMNYEKSRSREARTVLNESYFADNSIYVNTPAAREQLPCLWPLDT